MKGRKMRNIRQKHFVRSRHVDPNRVTVKVLVFLLLLLPFYSATTIAKEGKIQVSDSFPVHLTYDKAGEKKRTPKVELDSSPRDPAQCYRVDSIVEGSGSVFPHTLCFNFDRPDCGLVVDDNPAYRFEVYECSPQRVRFKLTRPDGYTSTGDVELRADSTLRGNWTDSLGQRGTSEGELIRWVRRVAGESGSEIETPPIIITMRGRVTPKMTKLDDERYKLTFDVDIGPLQFSPGRDQIPTNIVKQIVQDEASVKLGFRRWGVILSKSSFADNPIQEHSFDGVFGNLSLLTVYAPTPTMRKVKVYWESEDCGPLHQEYLDAQRAYQDAMAAMPILDQFELVTRTLDEIEETLGASAKDLKKAAGKIGQVTDKSPLEEKLKELLGKTKGLSESVTGALEGVKSGLEKGAKNFEKVSKAAADMNQKFRKLEQLIKTSDLSPSKQLKTFKDYFGEARGLVGGLVKTIPGLGVFLNLYANAIEQIAHSAERIEAIVEERKELAKELGVPSPYATLANARERAKREQQKLFDNMQTLGKRLARECPGVDMSTEDYGKYAKMDDAGHRARDACMNRQPSMRDELAARRQLRAARATMYKNDADLLRPIFRREKARYDGMKARFKQLQTDPASFKRRGELGELLKDVEAFYKDQRRISEYKRAKDALGAGRGLSRTAMVAYEVYLQTRLNELKRLYSRLQNADKAKQDYTKAKNAYDRIRGQHAVYRACVREHIKQSAQKNGWDQRLVDAISSSVY